MSGGRDTIRRCKALVRRAVTCRSRVARPNACSSCYKLGRAHRRWLQAFHGLLRSRCNDLFQTGYKQVFADPPLLVTGEEETGDHSKMPTTTSPSGAKARPKAARKPAAAKASTARRSTPRASAQPRATRTTRQTPAAPAAFGDYAERAVLIPVGAALIARDRVVSTVSDTISSYSSTTKAQAQLKRFERRGVTARNRLEREVRKARVRFERDLRQRRRRIESTVSDLEGRRDALAKSGSDFANRVPDLVPDIANRVPDLATRVPELANRVQERVLSLV
jgi:hypothetical protein